MLSAFYFRLVLEAFNCEPVHRKGKPYHLFSDIFLPSFAHIISITHAGFVDHILMLLEFTLRRTLICVKRADLEEITSKHHFRRSLASLLDPTSRARGVYSYCVIINMVFIKDVHVLLSRA